MCLVHHLFHVLPAPSVCLSLSRAYAPALPLENPARRIYITLPVQKPTQRWSITTLLLPSASLPPSQLQLQPPQLLEMGFRPAIVAILRYLPDRNTRQTLLFSATMPRDVETMSKIALKDSYQFVDCVGEEESTHQHVPQQFTVCRQEHQVQTVEYAGGVVLSRRCVLVATQIESIRTGAC